MVVGVAVVGAVALVAVAGAVGLVDAAVVVAAGWGVSDGLGEVRERAMYLLLFIFIFVFLLLLVCAACAVSGFGRELSSKGKLAC